MNGQTAETCRGCGGHAVERTALRKASEPQAFRRLWAAFAERAHQGALSCPHCRATMRIVEHHGVELDICAPCGVVWFDSGERRPSTRMPVEPEPDVGWVEQQAEDDRLEREQALADARAGKGAHQTESADIVEGFLRLFAALLS